MNQILSTRPPSKNFLNTLKSHFMNVLLSHVIFFVYTIFFVVMYSEFQYECAANSCGKSGREHGNKSAKHSPLQNTCCWRHCAHFVSWHPIHHVSYFCVRLCAHSFLKTKSGGKLRNRYR